MRCPRLVALIVLVALTLGACGSDPDFEDVPLLDPPAIGNPPAAAPPPVPDGSVVVGQANIGGEIVDPARHLIDEVLVLESYPEQLVVAFTAGAEPCLAATATALSTDTTITVILDVGINTDALRTSCVAGEFEHSLNIALSQGIDGRDLVLAPPQDRAVTDSPPGLPAEITITGLSESAAADLATKFGYEWRVVERDGEKFGGTTDVVPNRINAIIVNGFVASAYLG